MCAAIRACLLLTVVAAGCVSNPAPDGWRQSPERFGRDGRGAWVELILRDGGVVAGELLSAELGGVAVLTVSGARYVRAASVKEARLALWDAELGTPLGWMTLGTLSTASHGFFLVFTAPAWLIVGSISAAIEAGAAIEENPSSFDSWRKWARFPQGLPPGVNPH